VSRAEVQRKTKDHWETNPKPVQCLAFCFHAVLILKAMISSQCNAPLTMPHEQPFNVERDMNCLDILAGVVSRCSSFPTEQTPLHFANSGETDNEMMQFPEQVDASAQEHRVSCHRCGNIRKKKIVCERPQVRYQCHTINLKTLYSVLVIVIISMQIVLFQ
jgi:hypothetical protein